MTRTPVACRAGMASDAGMLRSNNEDRAHADESSGIFLVVDGMGGHAAGEEAAETAVESIPRALESSMEAASTEAASAEAMESRIRKAIAAANNEIHQLSQTRKEWSGMACVLTLAVAQDDKLSVGHVGDSRLYLAFSGGLRKLTSDHSPVGEMEDRGELTEAEAMSDPRRNQVFRDVGSKPHQPLDEDFIETKSLPFRTDAAFLLCTDGLSDVLTNAEMNAIIQRYDGDPQHTAQELVDAANEAGGKDNVTVVFVAGPEFTGMESKAIMEARARHSITRMKTGRRWWVTVLSRLFWILIGAALGIAGWMYLAPKAPVPAAPSAARTRAHVLVDPSNPRSLASALAAASSGDVIEVPQGEYQGPIELREGIDVISVSPGESVIRAGANAPEDPGVGMAAHGVKAARITGFRIQGSAAEPLATGLLIDNSSVEINEIEIAGAADCAVRFTGNSAGVLRASSVHDSACGVRIEGESSPRVIGNRITGAPIDVQPPARPVLVNNTIEEVRTAPKRK